jgi:TPR repeat protein
MVAVIALVTAGFVHADTFEDAVAAAQKGDYTTAERGFRAFALKGDAVAQYYLGMMYDNGHGVPQDYQQAALWYRKAADQGYARAQYYLGNMYNNGQGVPQDYQQAVFWCRKAADQGYTRAQNYLGNMYGNGQGVPQDYQQAYFWLLLASVSGDAGSIKFRDIVDAELTPQQRAAAQAQVRDWKPRKQ